MKPTGDDFAPRRDGWYEHDGTWGEVGVGTVIATPNSRKQRWEIIDVAMSTPVPYMKTLWMRAREQSTGQEFTVEPRTKTAKVVILTQDPADTRTAGATPPSDADAIWALVEGLGATLLASRDEATGEITCPDYINESHIEGLDSPIRRGLIEHMKIAHGHDQGEWFSEASLAALITTHAKLHDVNNPAGKSGFPHRHVPEDLTLITGRRA